MSAETDEQQLQAIADEIERGSDPYVVPEEMLIEPEKLAPVNKNLYATIFAMSVGEKLKLALRGNRDARGILIRDPNRLIQRFVLQNPRLTEEEVIAIARNRNIEGELLRRIGDHKHWPRNYQVRLALVTNSKTPLATVLHFVGTLTERDLRFLAKSKNVSATVVSQARRLLAQREPH
jgi:hypothetical protein